MTPSVVNLTAHEVRVIVDDATDVCFLPSGRVARLREEVTALPSLSLGDGLVPLTRVRYESTVEELPDQQPDVIYLVSRVLAAAVGRAPVDPRNRFMSGLPAQVLAQALTLGGDCFALDAACASSLYAIKLACDALHHGRADRMPSPRSPLTIEAALPGWRSPSLRTTQSGACWPRRGRGAAYGSETRSGPRDGRLA